MWRALLSALPGVNQTLDLNSSGFNDLCISLMEGAPQPAAAAANS